MAKKRKPCLDNPSKMHDSVMNNIEGILSSLYNFEWKDYCDRKSYEKASAALSEFFHELAEHPESEPEQE